MWAVIRPSNGILTIDSSFLQTIRAEIPRVKLLAIGPNVAFDEPIEIVRFLQSNRNILSLKFDNLVSTRDGDGIAENIARLFRFRSKLVRLSFHGCLSEAGFSAIGEALSQYPPASLQILDLDECEPDDVDIVGETRVELSEGAVALSRGIAKTSTLKTVLINVSHISASGTCQILNAMNGNQCIETLVLSGVEPSTQIWNVLGTFLQNNNNSLTHLGFKSSYLKNMSDMDPSSPSGSFDLSLLSSVIAANTTLETLALDHWAFDAPTLHVLVDGLIQNQSLEDIGIRGNLLNTESMNELCRLITCRATGTINLIEDGIDGDLLLSLCEAIRQAQGLHCLYLCYNEITDSGATHLAKMLQVNSELTRLDLTGHAISDDGFAALGKALAANNSLKVLSLASEDKSVTLRGIEALIDGVKNNRELIELDLPNAEQWPEAVTKKLEVYLHRNRVLTPLLKANLPLALWPYAMERSSCCDPSSPDILFALIKEKCELFQCLSMTRKRKRRRTRR